MDRITAEEVINDYVELKSKNTEDKIKEALKEKIYEDIEKQITCKKMSEILDEVDKKEQEKQKKRKLTHMKVLIFETLFISFLIGLIVNQVTDLITQSKGTGNIITWIWIVSIGAVLGLFIFLMYIEKIEDYINKRNDKE
ncbi:MAG: hypothetical protein GX309_05730 [Clostridiales bacterium]|nr:hypothetical protein [Clostridiales bacterium]